MLVVVVGVLVVVSEVVGIFVADGDVDAARVVDTVLGTAVVVVGSVVVVVSNDVVTVVVVVGGTDVEETSVMVGEVEGG